MTAARGPYGGYLEQVTIDYFWNGANAGLRGTHTQVLTDMPPPLQRQVQPWLHDTIPIPGVPTPPLMRQLNCGTLGAWGNYIGDAYNGGEIAPVQQRREVAIRSTLTMGFLGAVDSAVRESAATRTDAGVAAFYRGVQGALVSGDLIYPVADLAEGPQMAALSLAQYMHYRLGVAHPNRQGVMASDLSQLISASDQQLHLPHNDIEGFIGVARTLGEATAWMALRHTELANPNEPRHETRGRHIALALGRIGGFINHGSQVLAAVKDHMPTYATAILVDAGGASARALQAVDERRQDLVSEAVREGREALEPGNRRQAGIFRMAVRLLGIKEHSFATRGKQEDIDKALQTDPFWNPAAAQ